MTDYRSGSHRPIGTSTSSTLRWDAKILRDTLRVAIYNSPDSFLKTLDEIDAKPLDCWIDEVRSSTWAVAQRDEEIVGIAASKRPDVYKDKENWATTRYIESIWIAPRFRRQRLAERLIKYLLEAEYRENQQIRRMLLWVFASNSYAITLYERMGFVPTGEMNEGIKTEIKYCLDFDCLIYGAVCLAVNEAARREDMRQYGVTYRVLGRTRRG